MNTKTTLVLLILVCAIGGGIWYLDRAVPTTEEREAGDQARFEFAVPEVDHVEVRYPDERSFVLALNGGFWRVTEPFNDVANPERVQELLSALNGVQLQEGLERDEFDKGNWKDTGLGERAVQLRVLQGADIVLEVGVGEPASLLESAYLSVPDEDGDRLYLARTQLPFLLAETAELWRDDKLIRVPPEAVRRLVMEHEEGQIELEQVEAETGRSEWRLTKPIATRASREQVDEFLAILLNLDVIDVSKEELNGAAEAVETNGNGQLEERREMKVTLGVEGAGEFELKLTQPEGGESTTADAYVSHRRSVFRVRSEKLEQLWVEPNSLRDRHLADIDAESVQRLVIESQRFPAVKLKQENQTWMLERHGAWEPANGARVASTLQALNDTLIREFTADSAADLGAYGLDDPFLKLRWVIGEQKSEGLIFGQNEDGTAFYVKSQDAPFVYRISAELLPEISPDGLKWRDLGVLRYSAFALRRIQLDIGSAPTVVLNYDPKLAAWSGDVGGQDLTEAIDRVKADALAARLGKLEATEWSGAIAEGVQALTEPVVQLQITLQDPLDEEAEPTVHRLQFAPTQPGRDTAFFYGRLDNEPDIFYLARDSLRALVAPVLKDAEPAAN